MEKNTEKQEIYSNMKVNLKKAMRSGFYYEAVFIEYAIIEDRCASVLKHAGVKFTESNGHEIKLADKLRRLRGNPKFDIPYARKRIPIEFIDRIESWKRERDGLIHALAKMPYDHEGTKSIAEEGMEIVNLLDNKVKSINNYFKKAMTSEAK